MRTAFAKKIFILLLLTVCVCVLFVAGCVENDQPPIDEDTYTITFETGVDGLTVAPIKAKAGDKIAEPTSPQREGYRFDGWMLNGEPYVFDTMPEQDITLVAAWALADNNNTYTITFETGVDGLTVAPIKAKAGEKIAEPTSPKRDGYKFMGWFLNDELYEFDEMPAKNIVLYASWELADLPAMYIDLADANGNTLPIDKVTREAYVNSTITLTNTDEDYELDSLKAEFKGRGNGSWNDIPYPKRGYKIKFDKKQSLFGREKNKHWVIIACVNFDDITMSRNYLAYNMANEVFDGIEYTTPAYWIEVYINNEYRGVYLLCEHVRVGEGRVDIESEYGVEDTGYLIEYDAYATGKEGVDYFRVSGVRYAFTVHSPDPEDYASDGNISEAVYMKQIVFIKNYVSKVYTAALTGDYNTFSELADVDSFVDMYILHELFKNVDTGYSSFYLYKKPGGKLYAGPAWDFDATTNTAYDRGDRNPQGLYVAGTGSGSALQGSDFTSSELYIALYRKNEFKNAVRAHWKVLSPAIRVFLDGRLNDDVYEAYKSAMGKNFEKWKGKSQTQAENDWVNDVKILKKWLLDRIAWLDNEWK